MNNKVEVTPHPAVHEDGRRVHDGLFVILVDGEQMGLVWKRPAHHIHFFQRVEQHVVDEVQQQVVQLMGEQRPISWAPDLSQLDDETLEKLLA